MSDLQSSNALKACRRCEDCGIRTRLKSEDEERCILQCARCGKIYPFSKKPEKDRLLRGNQPGKDVYDIVIVGGGPGGLSAGIYAMRAAMKTVLIEKGLIGGQMSITKGIENYPGFVDVEGFELSDRFLQHAKAYGLEIRQQEVLSIGAGPDFHSVYLSGGEVLETYTVIIAAGGTARRLGIPGEMENLGRGVSYCATCDGFFFGGRVVAVVGGGDTALEESLYFSKITSHVHLIHRRNDFRAGMILQQRVASEPGIGVILNTVVTEIFANEEGVSSIRLRRNDGFESMLDVEGIFIFIGYNANSGLAPPGVRMNESGYVLTDEKCETSIPGIFAIGDLRQKYANQIVVAASDGCIAALAASRCVEMRKAGYRNCTVAA